MSLSSAWEKVEQASHELDQLLCPHATTHLVHKTVEVYKNHRHEVSGIYCDDCTQWMMTDDDLATSREDTRRFDR